MTKKIIHLIAAVRPNIIKIAPLYRALAETDWAQPELVHTGQHYEANLFGAMLDHFGLGQPEHSLHVGSGSHAQQTGSTMIAYEALCTASRPDLVVVPGDVNATLACALAARKLNIPVAHLEAGLRSFDRAMPEEINRLAVDAISDFLWTPSPDATAQLLKESADPSRVLEAGNIMIDAYRLLKDRIDADDIGAVLKLPERYAVMTFHRPSNVDAPEKLSVLADIVMQAADCLPVVFPVHPRTAKNLAAAGLDKKLLGHARIYLCDALPYVPFMRLVRSARAVVTDSGGMQEETTYLGVPCLTMRENTERPITITHGTNRLVSPDQVIPALQEVLAASRPALPPIPNWDGYTAQRIVAALAAMFRR